MKKEGFLRKEQMSSEQRELAMLLKNKRIEQGRKLEDIASGICSTSYLSRIENNQVKLQDPYLRMLFEKLDINYDDLKKERQTNIFIELVKYQLLEQYDKYASKIESIIKSKCYLGIERDLILLYDNVLKGYDEETKFIIDKLESSIDMLSNQEIAFYMYLITVYYYQIQQTNLAYQQIKILIKTENDNEILKWLIQDLYLTILFDVGEYELYCKMYSDFIKEAPSMYFGKHFIKHKMKMLTILAKYEYQISVKKMEDLHQNLDDKNSELLTEYAYYFAIIKKNGKQAEEIIEKLCNGFLSTKIIKLLSIMLNEIEDKTQQELILKTINKFAFSKYDSIVKNLCYYSVMKQKQMNNIWLLNYLKMNVYNLLKYSFDKVIFDFVIKEIIILGTKCSKYKETCRLAINYLEGLNLQLLNN